MLIDNDYDMIVGRQCAAKGRKANGSFQGGTDCGGRILNARSKGRTPDADKIAFRNLDINLFQATGNADSHKVFWAAGSVSDRSILPNSPFLRSLTLPARQLRDSTTSDWLPATDNYPPRIVRISALVYN